MKYPLLLPLSLLLLGFVSCHKATAPAPADPFLGHWQAETVRTTSFDATGQVASQQTDQVRQDLDVTATALTTTGYRSDGSPLPSSTSTYTRSGEILVFPGVSAVLVVRYVRSLTPTSFTLESTYYGAPPASAPTATSYIDFHR